MGVTQAPGGAPPRQLMKGTAQVLRSPRPSLWVGLKGAGWALAVASF